MTLTPSLPGRTTIATVMVLGMLLGGSVGPTSASAAVVSASGTALTVNVATGQNNDLSAYVVGSNVVITDVGVGATADASATLAGCTPMENNKLGCPAASFSSVAINVGDGNDYVGIGLPDTFTVALDSGSGTDETYLDFIGHPQVTMAGNTEADSVRILGTGEADTFAFRPDGSHALLLGGRAVLQFAAGEPRPGLIIAAIGGNDTLDGRAAARSFTFNGGVDDDSVRYDAGPSATFQGGTGTDTIEMTLTNRRDVWTMRKINLLPTGVMGSQRVSMEGFSRLNLNGQAGNDSIAFETIVRLNLTRSAPTAATPLAATVHGGAGNDVMLGSSAADRLFGDAGEDRLTGRGGDDHLLGGAGRDWLYGNAGDDRLEGGAAMDWLAGGAGTNVLRQ